MCFAFAFGAASVAGAGVFVRSRILGCGGWSTGIYWADGALTMSADLALGFALGFAFGLGPSSGAGVSPSIAPFLRPLLSAPPLIWLSVCPSDGP